MQVKPIILARTQLDLNQLSLTSKQAIGWTVNRNIDSKKLQKDAQRFISALSEFGNKDFIWTPDLEGLVLDHYHYMLGIVLESYVYHELLLHRGLHVLGQDTTKHGFMYVLVSGSLRNWRDAVIDGSTRESTVEIRELMNAVHTLFVHEGLQGLWSNYSRLKYEDTMILIEK